MKLITILISLFHITLSFGQPSEEKLYNLNTTSEAELYFKNHPEEEGEIFTVSPEIDGELIKNEFADRKVGDIFSKKENTFKIIASNEVQIFRVSYIFLDESKISLKKINETRNKILKKYEKGISFSQLASQYTMDSTKDGDLGWYTEGMMVTEFESAVKQHKINDIFKVDIPERKWFYIVLKTFEDKKVNQFTVIKIKSSK
jgi:parvulin-like peptidyl-prolyl isomerase